MKNKKCLRCGDCCQAKTLIKTLNWKEKLLLYILKSRYIFDKDVKCPALEFRNGKAYCKQYSQRPQFCRDYFCEKAIKNKN